MKKYYTLAGAFLWIGVSFGQAPFIKNDFSYASGEKHAPFAITTIDNRKMDLLADRSVYYTENFDAGFGGWVEEIQTGTVGFKLTDTGHENDPENTFQIPVLTSSTPTQWVVLDSDGDGTAYADDEAATLTSPMMNLDAAVGSFVALTFEQFFAEWQPVETEDHCFIGVSTDGTTWTEIEINEGVGREARLNPEYVSWDITDLIAGAESTVWVRFRWDGAWNYGWQIDNVQIEDINESDLEIGSTYRNYDGGIVYSQIAESHAREFVIGAIIKNVGHVEQTNVHFDYVINGPDGGEVASGTSTDMIATLQNGEQDTILHETGYTPDVLGEYKVIWTAVADDADDEMVNNTTEDGHFMLTEFTMALDYNEGAEVQIDNWPLKTGEAYFGNLMTFEIDDIATAMQIKIADNTEIAGEIIVGTVWEFAEGGTDWILIFNTDDYAIKPTDIGNFVTFDLEELNVTPTSTYLFCGYQYSSASAPLFVKQGDIGFNNIQGKDDEFANRGFFDRLAPIVRVRLNEGEVGIDENNSATTINVFPNPANEVLNIHISSKSLENTLLNIVDISGKTVQTVTLNGSNQISVSLEGINAGVYFIEMVNANGKLVKKFIKK